MNNLKNLVRLEFIKLGSLEKTLFLSVIMAFVFMLFKQLAAAGYVLFLYIWVYSPAAYDEVNKGEYLLCTLPVTRREIVFSRYLYALCGVVITTVFAWLCGLLGYPFGGSQLDIGDIGNAPIPLSAMLLVGCIFVSVVLPVILHFGVAKARVIVMIIYVLGIGLTSSLIVAGGRLGLNLPVSSSLVLSITGPVLLVISCIISLRLFEKRQII